ncbi:TPA: hypothetical protein HA244_01500 [Candidatus Micrarchaeota archaeon]|nr:hypothetical protein [Candidatus Micrarchaeota archaeon]
MNWKLNGIAFLVLGLLFSGFASAHQITTTTTLSFFPGGTVSDGTLVTITGHVAVTGSQHPNPTPPWEGTMQIQECLYIADGSGAPSSACGNASIANWVNIATGTPDDSGDFSTVFDTTGLAGSVIGFRAHYVPNGPGGHKPAQSQSPAADLTIVAACDGVQISADLASGNGMPAPGYSGTWVYRIRVKACEGATGVFAQGGTSGWTNFANYSQSTGSVNVRFNRKNEVLRWIIGDMISGQEETLLVTLSGQISRRAACNSTQYLSGPWSTTYSLDGGANFVKSDYTGRVSVTVTC